MFSHIVQTFGALGVIGAVLTAFLTMALSIPMMIFLGLIGICALLGLGIKIWELFPSKEDKKPAATPVVETKQETVKVDNGPTVDQRKPQPEQASATA